MSNPIKILICGYSHCGTSILKSIVGHIEEVEEIINECDWIYENDYESTNKKYIMCKCSRASPKYFSKKYEDYIKIFIIRNPIFVFSSINKRLGHYKLTKNRSISRYFDILKMFIKFKNNPKKNIYTIRYEDLFPDNFKELKKILDAIGFQYDDNIFDNTKYRNRIFTDVKIPTEKPSNKNHKSYRSWQLNQPFILNNDISKIDLSLQQKNNMIKQLDILQKIYPDITKTFQLFKCIKR